MKQLRLTAVIEKDGDWYSSLCPELGVSSQGKSYKEAMDNLKEAVELYLEDEYVQKELKKHKISAPRITTFAVPLPV